MSEKEKVLERAVLVFLIKDEGVALPLKKKKIGRGLRNGYGGGIEEGETPVAAMIREVSQEAKIDIDVDTLTPIAVVDFHNITLDDLEFTCRVYVSLLSKWSGTPQETEEMGPPEWFSCSRAPLHEAMLADRDWMPHILAGKRIYAEAWYGPRQATLRQATQVREIDLDELKRLWNS